MKRVIMTFTAIFILATACTIAFADAVPGAVLFLDASDNPDHPKAWKNLGEAGGSLSAADTAPELEEGPIKIASLGINQRKAMYYTAKKSRQTFGGPVHKNPKLFLADWTLEFLCKRNGNLFQEEHHFAGFQNSPAERAQGIRLWLLGGGQELGISIHAKGAKQAPAAIKIDLEQDVWTWVTLVATNKKSIVAYQDGKEISNQGGFEFDKKPPDAAITNVDMAALTTLHASRQKIQDLTGLEFATKLTDLDLRDNRITDLSPLAALTSLEYLNISENPLSHSDLTPIAGLTNLVFLDIYETGISDLSALAGLTNLISLTLWHNEISDLTPLAGLTQLETLSLERNRIWDISPLSGLVNLDTLRLSHNYISDLSPLSELSNLGMLDLVDNKISDLAPLATLPNLTHLMLMSNRIYDVSPLANINQLEVLALGENFLTDVSPLASLTKLKDCHLYFNHVTDLSPFLKLGNLKRVDAQSNPLAAATISAHIPALEILGVEVDYDFSEENKAEREAQQEAEKYQQKLDKREDL